MDMMEQLQTLRHDTEITARHFIQLYLRWRGIDIKTWIERYKHDIYHFYCTSRCDLCTLEYQLPNQRLLYQEHIYKLFEIPKQSKGNLDAVHAIHAKDISVDDIDIEIADCLLQHCSDDLYWYCCLNATGRTLAQFLNEHKKEIYRLVTGAKPPDSSITTEQCTFLFGTTYMECNHRVRDDDFEEVVAIPTISVIDIYEEGGSLGKNLLNRFCEFKRALNCLLYYGRRIYTYESTKDTYVELKEKMHKASNEVLKWQDILSQHNTQRKLLTSQVQPPLRKQDSLKAGDTKNSIAANKNQSIMTTNSVENIYHSKQHVIYINRETIKKLQALKNVKRNMTTRALEPRRLPGKISVDIELNTNIFKAQDRVMTFVHWPSSIRYWPYPLAEAGFIYTGTDSIVQCCICKIKSSVGSWSHNENPAQAHARLNPNCEFVIANGLTKSLNATLAMSNVEPETTHDGVRNSENNMESIAIKADLRDNLKSHEVIPSYDVVVDSKRERMQAETQSDNHQESSNDIHYGSENVFYPLDTNFTNQHTITELWTPMDVLQNISHKQTNGMNDFLNLTCDTNVSPQTGDISENIAVNTEHNKNEIGCKYDIETFNRDSSDICQDNFAAANLDVVDRSQQSQVFQHQFNEHSFDNSFGFLHNNVIYKYPQFQTYSQRINSYRNWIYSVKQKPDILSAAGYFYTGEADVVRCFCCDLGLAEWDVKDDPWVEHARHNSSCWFLKNEKGEEFIKNVQMEWKKIYNPKHAAFEDKKSRLATFEGVWRGDVEQTPDILADAGFYYTGEEDVVRCHYCDGGLRHWDTGDIPWEEHARWFPFCKFAIKMKGKEYIDSIRQKYENMEREQEMNIHAEESFSVHPFLKQLEDLSFKSEDIKSAMRQFLQRKGHTNFELEDLIDIILECENQDSNGSNSIAAQNIQRKEVTDKKAQNIQRKQDTDKKDPGKLREINRQLKEKMLCLRCKTNEISMLFPNCGHRITCETCAYQLDYCPYCNKKIKKRMKTFLS